MSIGGLLVALFLAVIVGFIVLAPLLIRYPEGGGEAAPPTAAQRERLLAYYERVLRNLRDLDEDQALGKIEPELYEQDRALWVERGVQALKALDALDTLEGNLIYVPTAPTQGSAAGKTTLSDATLDDAIEAAVQAAARRAKSRAE